MSGASAAVKIALPLTLESLYPALPLKFADVDQTPGAVGLRLQLPVSSFAFAPLTNVSVQLIGGSSGMPWRKADTEILPLGRVAALTVTETG